MNNQHRPLQHKAQMKLKPMLGAIYFITLLSAGSGISDAIIKGLGL